MYRRIAQIPRGRRFQIEALAKKVARHLIPVVDDLTTLEYKELCYLRIHIQRQLRFKLPPRPAGDTPAEAL
jgi:hypothetical protein